MYYNFLVKIPENTGKISYNKRGATTYVEYTYERVYHPEKKYNKRTQKFFEVLVSESVHFLFSKRLLKITS